MWDKSIEWNWKFECRGGYEISCKYRKLKSIKWIIIITLEVNELNLNGEVEMSNTSTSLGNVGMIMDSVEDNFMKAKAYYA